MERLTAVLLTALLSVHRRAVNRGSEASMLPHFPHNTAYTIAGRPLLRFLAPSVIDWRGTEEGEDKDRHRSVSTARLLGE